VSNITRITGMAINGPILHTQTQARWLGLPSKKHRKRAVIANPRKSNSRANAQSPPYTSNCQPDIFGALLANGWIASNAPNISTNWHFQIERILFKHKFHKAQGIYRRESGLKHALQLLKLLKNQKNRKHPIIVS
jgi:hypothetical protein